MEDEAYPDISIYGDSNFSAENTARHYFATLNEQEIAKKQRDMSILQHSIENILKRKVKDNYHLFLLANDEINSVSKEMAGQI